MYLRDINVSADPEIVERYKGGFVQKFGRDVTCITALYRSLIHKKVVTVNQTFIHLKLTNMIDAPPQFVPGAVSYYWPFDFATYRPAGVPTKKRLILDELQRALLWIADQYHWKTEPFNDAYQEIIRRGLILEETAKKSWASPDGKWRVRVPFRYDLESIELFAALYRNHSSREITRKLIGKAMPFHACLPYYLEDGDWISSTKFELRSSTFAQEKWSADFSEEIKAAAPAEA